MDMAIINVRSCFTWYLIYKCYLLFMLLVNRREFLWKFCKGFGMTTWCEEEWMSICHVVCIIVSILLIIPCKPYNNLLPFFFFLVSAFNASWGTVFPASSNSVVYLWSNRCLSKDTHMPRLVYLKELF